MSTRNTGAKFMVGGQEGRVTFFGIVTVVILVIAAAILFMVLKEVLRKEQIPVTVQVKNDIGYPVYGAAVSKDRTPVAYTDSNGVYAFSYTSDKKNTRCLIRVEIADYDPAETTFVLTGNKATITLSLQRAFASLTVVTIDSLTSNPVSGVMVSLGDEQIDTTDMSGAVIMPPQRLRIHDMPVIKLEKKKYQPKIANPFLAQQEQSVTFRMFMTEKRDSVIIREPSPLAFAIMNRATPVVRQKPPVDTASSHGVSPPPGPTSIDSLPPIYAAREDSAFIYMSDGQYRQAFDIYLELLNQIKWQARADLFLYGADCALHLASDANGIYSEPIIDSALTFLDEAERNQNRILEDIFPAVVQTKKGEAWYYKCELPGVHNSARLQDYRKKARFYLMNAITQMNNRGLSDTDFCRYATKLRDKVDNY